MIFIDNKYTKIYYSIINRAIKRNHIKERFDGFQTHHIIPRCLGGSDLPDNLVVLSYKEHRFCHRLLIMMTEKDAKYRMMYAYKLFNKHYDISWVPSIKEYKPESYEKMVKTRKSNGSYKIGNDNNFSKPEIVDIVRKRMTFNNPMKTKTQRRRMEQSNNNPNVRRILVNGIEFPSEAAACKHFNITRWILKKNYNITYLDDRPKLPRVIKLQDKFVTPYGVFKTKKEIQKVLGIPEWTLNKIYDNLDACPVVNGRASKKISHLNIDSTKSWKENGFRYL